MRAVLALACAFSALLVSPQAKAGGWWTWPRLDRETVAVGERVQVQAYAFVSAADAIEAEQKGYGNDEFYVYLLRGLDHSIVARAMRQAVPRDWWSLGDAAASRVAPVRFGDTGSNLANVSASFTVPPLPIGTYALMLCNAGCRRPLANVIPARGFTIVADPATARLARRTARLELRARGLAERLDETRTALWSAEASASIAQAEVTELSKRVDATDARVRAAERSVWEHLPWLAAGLALGLVVAFGIRRRTAPADWQPTDAELSELLASERPRTRA